jgi:cereblon
MLRDEEVDTREEDEVEEEEYRRIRCRVCNNEVADPGDVFRAGEDAVQVFVNQAGYAHEVITVLDAWNVVISGRPTTEFSWFPGYAWRHVLCGGCGNHVGWLYETVVGGSPRVFVGFRRDEVKVDGEK